VFAFKMMNDAEVSSPVRENFPTLASIEEVGTFKFLARWKQPNFKAIEAIGLDFPVVPAHALPSDGASFRKATTHLACGPYRIAAFEPSTKIELVLRDEYRTKPFPIRPFYIERFVYEAGTRDQTASLTRLINGEAHIVSLKSDQYAAEANDAAFKRSAWRSHFFISSYSYIAWNLRDPADLSRPHPVLGDVRVRKALSHVIPLDLLAAGTFRGLARPISGPVDFRDGGYDAGIPHPAFDPAAARSILRDAGWTPGGDGTLAKEGRPLKLTLLRFGDMFLPIVQALKEEARKIGVEINLEKRTVYDDLEGHQFDAGIVLWRLDPVEPDISDQWHSRFARVKSNNYSGFADPEVDRLLDQIKTSFDPKERATLRRKIHRRLQDEAPCAFLLANASTVGLSKSVANIKVHDLGIRFHDFVMRDRWAK
jgi:peptide/nickel transport system substrate-binding protein